MKMKTPISPLRQLLIVIPALVLGSGLLLAAEPGSRRELWHDQLEREG